MWKIYYGCEEWQDTENLPETEARKKYQDYCENLPVLGLYPATFVVLQNAESQTIESFEA